MSQKTTLINFVKALYDSDDITGLPSKKKILMFISEYSEDQSITGEFLRDRKKQVVHFFIKLRDRKKHIFTFLCDLRNAQLNSVPGSVKDGEFEYLPGKDKT